MALTKAGRAHEAHMQELANERDREANASAERMHQADLDAQAIRAQRQAEREEREANEARRAAEREAAAERRSKEEIARTEAETERYAIEKDSANKLRLGELQAETDRHEMNVDLEKHRISEEKEAEVKVKEYETDLEKTQLVEKTRQKALEEETIQVEINAKRDIALGEQEAEYKKIACQEVSKMFSTYVTCFTEAYKAELEFLRDNNIERRTKYLETLKSTREEQAKALELSKETKGQEKLNYLNRVDELENTIRELIAKDSKDEEILKANLAAISYKQQTELENHDLNKLNINTLFLEARENTNE